MTIDHHRIDRIARLSACYQAIQQVQDVLVLTADYGEAAVARDLKQQIAHKLLHINKESACSPASPAPSSSPTTSSSGSCLSSSSCSSSTSSAVVVADPSAAIGADPGRPVPDPDCERCHGCGWLYDDLSCAAGGMWFMDCSCHHVPQPQPEKAKEPEKMVRFCQIHQRQYTVGPTRMCPECDAACADFTTPIQPVEVRYLTVDSLPKRQGCPHPESMRALQMPGPNDHGRVWCGVCGHHFIGKPPEPAPAPNPTITTESILGTESAAKAVEQGVADVVEGRTRQVDSLDQLAAEAQAEGEYGTAWDRWKKLNGFYGNDTHQLFDRFVASECERAVRDYKAKPPTPRRSAREVAEDVALQLCRVNDTFTSLSAMRSIPIIQAAIERDREER